MHIELDQRDATFTNLSGPFGTYRALIVRIAGKPFFTMRSIETFMEHNPNYAENTDRVLIQSMAHILTRILEKSCLEVPEGVELLTPEEDERLTAKLNDVKKNLFTRMEVSL